MSISSYIKDSPDFLLDNNKLVITDYFTSLYIITKLALKQDIKNNKCFNEMPAGSLFGKCLDCIGINRSAEFDSNVSSKICIVKGISEIRFGAM